MTSVAAPTRGLVASDAMTSPAVVVTPGCTLWQAWTSMLERGLRHLIVSEGNRCVGVVDDRTLFAQWPMGPLALRRGSVSGIMRERVACVLPDTELSTVAAVMVADGVDAVPVIDARGSVLGIVTGSDLARLVARYGVCREPADAIPGEAREP